MSIIQFLRILWARRILVLVALVASVFGAFVVVTLVQPRYEATARVNMTMCVVFDSSCGNDTNGDGLVTSDHCEPFHCAMPCAKTPPALVKLPPA